MSGRVIGRLGWSGSRDEEGYRVYRVQHLVETLYTDGPQAAMFAPGLYLIGSVWSTGNDFDPWAWCQPNLDVSIHSERKGDLNKVWIVEQTFTNKPSSKRCQEDTIEDPLLEPQKVSGTFVQDTKEIGEGYTNLAAAAVGGARTKLLATSSHEALRGINKPVSRPTVRIEQNVPTLGLATFSEMVGKVNDASLWGLSKRCVKLTNASWERRILGTCDYYYTRTFDFEIDPDTFDHTEHDYGKMALGNWEKAGENWVWVVAAGLNADNPGHFSRYADIKGNLAETFLNGAGLPVENEADAASIDVIYEEEADFLQLGIPTVF